MSVVLLRAGLIYTVANVLSAGVPLLLLPILTRALSPAEYGEVVGFFILVSIAGSVAGLGVHSAVAVRWFSRREQDFPVFVGSAVWLAVLSTVVCAALLVAASVPLASRFGVPAADWPWAAVLAGATVIIGVRATLWQSQAKALRSALLQVIHAGTNVSLSLLAVFAFSLGAQGRIAGATLAGLCCAVAAVFLLRRSGDMHWATRRHDGAALLRFGLPLIPHSLAGAVLVSADRFSVAGVLGQEALGIYGAAAQLGMVMNVLGDALVKALTPWLYRQLAASSQFGALRVVALTYLLVPLWLIIALLLWLVISLAAPLLLGARYVAALDLLPMFLLGGAMASIYLNIAGLFFFTSKTEWLSGATALSSITAVLVAPALVAAYGLRGAALSYLAIQTLQLLLSWLLSTRIRPMPWKHPRLAARLLVRGWSRS
ncbi:MAG: oligosaccharide flippase family protein [Caldimonas sp.]